MPVTQPGCGKQPSKPNLPARIFRFYVDGFKSMTIGRTLWLIILLKLFILFFVLKLFFFQDFLGTKFSSDDERSDYVIDRITGKTP